ncbi:MAG: D-alanyl-D-alanine carboxypeptidase family protein [Peptococcaceae bacterium]
MKTVSLSRNMVHTGHLILVNRDHPYRAGSPDKMLAPVDATNNNVLLERHVASIYDKLTDELSARSRITAVSGWRSQREQEQIYSESLLENGADFTAKYVAFPGHSEHQTGLAVDLALNQANIDFLRPYFPYTGVCGAFREMAGRFGFIERYPEGKENITGITYEPWHFRYVGAPHAMIMEQTGDTLEEYHARIRQFPYGRDPLPYDFGSSQIEVSYLPADRKIVVFDIEDNTPYSVSGNNTDGFVVTVWRARR